MERHKHPLTCSHIWQVRIRDLWLVGSQTQVMTSGALLYAKNAQKCQFTNLQLTNFYVGIRAESVSRNARRQKSACVR